MLAPVGQHLLDRAALVPGERVLEIGCGASGPPQGSPGSWEPWDSVCPFTGYPILLLVGVLRPPDVAGFMVRQ
jgi:hypothetical protein